jgi:predicted DCC family thiol-disulfide oxidoreductase YuxK
MRELVEVVRSRVSDAAKSGAVIIYDGYCPFCSRLVMYLALREKYQRITLLDARGAPDLVEACRRAGFDLDSGFLVVDGNVVSYGSDGMQYLSKFEYGQNSFVRIIKLTFGFHKVGNLVYRILNAGRKIVLAMLNRPAL